jgi:hypothetical protein
LIHAKEEDVMSISQIEAKASQIALETHDDDTGDASRKLSRLQDERARLKKTIADKEKTADRIQQAEQEAAHASFLSRVVCWATSQDPTSDLARALQKTQSDEKRADAEMKRVQSDESDQLSAVRNAEQDLTRASASLEEMLDGDRKTAAIAESRGAPRGPMSRGAQRIEGERAAYEQEVRRFAVDEKAQTSKEDEANIARCFGETDAAIDTLQSGSDASHLSQNVGGGFLGFLGVFGNLSVAAIIGPAAALANAVVGSTLEGLAGKGIGAAVGGGIEAHIDEPVPGLDRVSAADGLDMQRCDKERADETSDADDAQSELDGIDRFAAQLRKG